MRVALLLMVLCLLPAPGARAAELAAETRWADPSRVQLNVDFPGNGYHASWQLFRCACGDLLVYAELAMPGEVESGELLLVGGRAVLIKGFGNYQAEAAASLDAAALMMQLALRLLERSEPGGPSRISRSQDVDLTDEINHIHLDTGYAEGDFMAPWSVAGRITAPTATLRKFDLNFTSTVPVSGGAQQASMRLYGEAEYAKTDFPVPPSSPLDEWKLDWRDEDRKINVRANTLKGLRAELGVKAGDD